MLGTSQQGATSDVQVPHISVSRCYFRLLAHIAPLIYDLHKRQVDRAGDTTPHHRERGCLVHSSIYFACSAIKLARRQHSTFCFWLFPHLGRLCAIRIVLLIYVSGLNPSSTPLFSYTSQAGSFCSNMCLWLSAGSRSPNLHTLSVPLLGIP